MPKLLEAIEIYERGLRELSSLMRPERLVYMLLEFENIMEMEGWDHFFVYEQHFAWYSELKQWLRTTDNTESLAVLDDYEAHLMTHGIEMSPSAVERFLDVQGDDYFQTCPDWRRQYCELKCARWKKAAAYLESQGFCLNVTGSDAGRSSNSN